jgi:hypothetical protein
MEQPSGTVTLAREVGRRGRSFSPLSRAPRCSKTEDAASTKRLRAEAETLEEEPGAA